MKHFTVFTLITSLLFFGCSKSDPTPVQAAFTLGNNGNCTGAVVSGKYNTDTILSVQNIVSISVNVTVLGAYNISTDTVNGISFSANSSFTSVGPQTVILKGTGTPVAAGTNTYTIHGNSGCTFNITTTKIKKPSILNCYMNGVYYDFSSSMICSLIYNPGVNFKVFGYHVGVPGENFTIWIQHPSYHPLIAGNSYDVTMSGFYIKGQFTDPVFNYWMDDSENPSPLYPFTVKITSISSTEVKGTFSGLILENAGYGPSYKNVTAGVFDVFL